MIKHPPGGRCHNLPRLTWQERLDLQLNRVAAFGKPRRRATLDFHRFPQEIRERQRYLERN